MMPAFDLIRAGCRARLRRACFRCLPAVLAIAGAGLWTSCRTPVQATAATPDGPAIRFLLTFDDGPSIRRDSNPTLSIARQLQTNALQPGIKAIFFVQSEHPKGGGTAEGRAIMNELRRQGHLIGIHSVTPRHLDHRSFASANLTQALVRATAVIRNAAGAAPRFVSPPFGAFDARTLRIYTSLDLALLLADIRARDGIIYGYNGSFFRRAHLRRSLAKLRDRLLSEPRGEDPVPVVVGFHDVNPYTARHMTEYLHILAEEAQGVGFRLPLRPFYDTTDGIQEAALARRVVSVPHGIRGREAVYDGREAIKPARGNGG